MFLEKSAGQLSFRNGTSNLRRGQETEENIRLDEGSTVVREYLLCSDGDEGSQWIKLFLIDVSFLRVC